MEAWGECGIEQRERDVQNPVTMDVCKLDLSSWNEVEIIVRDRGPLQLRKLTSAKQRILDL